MSMSGVSSRPPGPVVVPERGRGGRGRGEGVMGEGEEE